jgi:hypothetical protein
MRINHLPRITIITNNNQRNIMSFSIKVSFICSNSRSHIINPVCSVVPNLRLTITRATTIMLDPIPDAQYIVRFATGWMNMVFQGLVINRIFHRRLPFVTWHKPDSIRFT